MGALRYVTETMRGVYGWRCACGLSTTRARDGLDQGAAAACYACRILVEEGGTSCTSCGNALTPFDREGTFVEGSDRALVTEQSRKRILDETLRERHWTRGHPKPPYPADATLALPGGWSRTTDQTRAYDEWFAGMYRTWATEKASAMADRTLVAEVEREIEPVVHARVVSTMAATRKHKCPACGAFTLEFFGVPFPI